MNVLMVGVGPKRLGGMLSVANQYINSKEYNNIVNLIYVATSTNGSMLLRALYMLVGYMKILWILNTKPIDIVHIHMAEKGSTFRKGRVAKWAHKRNIKVIIHLHAGPFMSWYNTVSNHDKRTIRTIFGYGDRILVLGEYWKKELSAIIPSHKMNVLYNGIDCPVENPYNSNARNIVYFGVMRKEKGTYDLITAIERINSVLPTDIKVVLCGYDLEGNIEQVIKEAGLSNRFELPGWVSGKKKEEIFKNAMIDVLPSYFEGLSMTVLEAMARGIPVITTNISTMPEVLGEKGIMVTPGDISSLSEKIMMVVNSSDYREQYGKYEFKRARRLFSETQMIKSTLTCYDELLRKQTEC